MAPTGPRRPHAVVAPAVLCLAALATLGFPGCENVTGPSGGRNSSAPTMSSSWPNDDGRYWNYGASWGALESDALVPLPLGAEVPEITLAMARKLLADEVTVTGGGDFSFQLRFDGMVTTQSGITAQSLVEQYSGATVPSLLPFERRFLDQLALARPGLSTLRSRPAAANGASLVVTPVNFIHGYAWDKNALRIGTYGDLDTLLAWKFLESDVRPGHTFRHPLVPSLASDVWLLGGVEQVVPVEIPGVLRSPDGLEVIYVVDYGVQENTDPQRPPVGKGRFFDYGRVIYVPGVGPVSDLERHRGFVGQTVTHGSSEVRLTLQQTGAFAPAMHIAEGR